MSLESTIRMMTEKKVVKEDGHTDVASAKRQCKTAMEDAQAIIGVLDGMNDEDALPTWWTNKLAIASNSMNKLNDYLSNPTEQIKEGTWELPKTPKQKTELKKLMSKPIILGKGGDKAISVVGAYIGDDELYDDLGVAGDKNPKGDARPIIDKWMKKNFTGSWSKYAIEEVELDESVQETEMYDLDNLIEEALDEEVKYPHMMYDPETGKGVEAKTPEDHDKLAKKGYTHEKPEIEEAVKYEFAAVDKKGLVIGFSSKESDAKDMARRNKGTVVKLKKPMSPKKGDMMINRPLKEETVNEHTHYKMEPFGVSRSLVDSVKAVLAGKPQEEALDKVNPKAVKKKFDDRKDKDIDNDGDVDDSDEYLHKRRQAISKAVKGEEKDDKKKDKKDEKNGKKEPIEIDPEIKEDTVKEAEMTDAQMKRREEIVKELKKKEDEFKERYGDRWKEVMYATATKMAMKEAKK